MKFQYSHRVAALSQYLRSCHLQHRRRFFTSFLKNARAAPQPPAAAAASSNGGSDAKGNPFLLPGATLATLLMLGGLHVRRLYNDKKIEEAREKGIELEFKPDVKAAFLEMMPLRSISRIWGSVTSVEIPTWLRPHVYKAWARAFHANLEEAALPLENYSSLREFFVRTLREGSRPIDPDPRCLISPVDGTVLRFGELRGSGAMVEQVKGWSYPVTSLLGSNTVLPMITESDTRGDSGEQLSNDSDQKNNDNEKSKKSWWRVSFASPKVRDDLSAKPAKGLYYCVIYLNLGDYHRIHSPADWNVLARRHFSAITIDWILFLPPPFVGRLFPVNERATRTIRNLYVENERAFKALLYFHIHKVYLIVSRTDSQHLHLCLVIVYPKPSPIPPFVTPEVESWQITPTAALSHLTFSFLKTMNGMFLDSSCFFYFQVVLEGTWREGFMAMAAVGATNIGSIELSIEPELRTNLPRKMLLNSGHPEERKYDPQGVGKILKKGDEVAAFNMGSTVVLVFQAPTLKPLKSKDTSSEFRFTIRRGDRVRVGEALGRWNDSSAQGRP
ncbi:hypothetical protein Tsubulata_015263 [Turnera subulata]|uniref:Phosphatidylserine decarboxylase n=1 Tax=Turnera subulata TaxID=218843 RepID=A0A9Q0J8I0_9ROSI|nr:hypothetical protein Tsubulata_015263 [Turnera subulata]